MAVYNYDPERLANFKLTTTAVQTPGYTAQQVNLAADTPTIVQLPAAQTAGVFVTSQYRLTVPVNASRLQVSIASTSEVFAMIRKNIPVSLTDLFLRGSTPEYFFSSRETVGPYVIDNGSSPPLQAGTYYLALVNFSPTAGTATVRYTLSSPLQSGKPIVNTAVNAASSQPTLASDTWVTLYGQNLATTTRSWSSSDFSGRNLPTKLDDVSVTIGSKAAYVNYISPTQVNILAPSGLASGLLPIQLSNNKGVSDIVTANAQQFSPAFFMFNTRYIASINEDGTLSGPPNLFGGTGAPRPARPGKVISLYSTGLGPTSPVAPTGVLLDSVLYRLASSTTITIGGAPAQVLYAGLAPGLVGLYQINVIVPDLPDGDKEVILTVGGVRTQSGASLFVQR